MNFKLFISAIAMALMMGVAVLAGSLLVPRASAGAPVTLTGQAAQPAQTTPTVVPGKPQEGQPKGPGWAGPGFGGRGHGPGDFRGPAGFGGAYTAEGAARVISSTTSIITLVSGDLTYAAGKMDTAKVQDWLNRADNLLKTAQSANSSGQYGKAVETAQAAGNLARAADLLMQQALGADKLPSYNQRPFGGRGRPGFAPGTNANITQAQASRELAGFYNAIIQKEALLKNSGSTGDARTYLDAAKDTYKTAYAAYQAGKYSDVQASVEVGQTLLGVAGNLMRAGTAPNSPDTPVQVPAPNF
jgi:hypothetical protein